MEVEGGAAAKEKGRKVSGVTSLSTLRSMTQPPHCQARPPPARTGGPPPSCKACRRQYPRLGKSTSLPVKAPPQLPRPLEGPSPEASGSHGSPACRRRAAAACSLCLISASGSQQHSGRRAASISSWSILGGGEGPGVGERVGEDGKQGRTKEPHLTLKIESGLKTPHPNTCWAPSLTSTQSPAFGAGLPTTLSTAPLYTIG